MTLRPFFRKAARLEYDEAASWYEAQRPGLGAEFVTEIEHALLQACEMPQRFPRMLAEVRCVRVRRLPYSIFFRVRAEQLIVLAVFHAVEILLYGLKGHNKCFEPTRVRTRAAQT